MTRMEALTAAIMSGDAQSTAEILEAEPGLNSLVTSGGATPLLLALYYGNRDIAQLIIRRGHELSLHEAAAYGDLTRVRELVEAQPELVNRTSADGHWPLGLACFFIHPPIVDYLIEKGADVNAASQNNQRVTPLHAAAASRSVSIASTLLENGADVNTRQNGGFTPLHAAAQNGQVALIKLLLEYGAQPDVKADNGQTPFDQARQNDHAEAANLLKPVTSD
jgi:uncharacterized protein